MFTGIIEEVGVVERVTRTQSGARLVIRAEKVLGGTKVGDSIAVDGVCLTVTETGRGRFEADVMRETLSRSTLGALTVGSMVDLERAVRADGRLGGHIVSGHVDGKGRIARVRRDGIADIYEISAGRELLCGIVEKGSIAVDGISLTVAKKLPRGFTVSVIPHTLENTVLPLRRVGDEVNLETDVIGKYAVKSGGGARGVTLETLAECGFLQ